MVRHLAWMLAVTSRMGFVSIAFFLFAVFPLIRAVFVLLAAVFVFFAAIFVFFAAVFVLFAWLWGGIAHDKLAQ